MEGRSEKKMKRYFSILLLLFTLLLLTQIPAQAILYKFYGIKGNESDIAIGESQLFVDVTPSDSNQVLFTFSNIGSEASSITDVYFDDNLLLSNLSWIDNSDPGVSFSEGAKPKNLPGGRPFHFNADFSADSDPPVSKKGVNPGESLGMLFNLRPNKDFEQVLTGLNSQDFRIGMHVQAFNSGRSASFINKFAPAIPEPASFVLFGTIVGIAGIVYRKRKPHKTESSQKV